MKLGVRLGLREDSEEGGECRGRVLRSHFPWKCQSIVMACEVDLRTQRGSAFLTDWEGSANRQIQYIQRRFASQRQRVRLVQWSQRPSGFEDDVA